VLARLRHASEFLEQVAVEGSVLELREGRVEEVIDLAQIGFAQGEDLRS
jgi:hypothetical protein